MRRLSILSVMLLVVLLAILSTLFARLHEEAFFYITGPLFGAMLAPLAYRHDRSALITGAAVGGLCQGIFVVLVLKRGYMFPDIDMITGAMLLAALAGHLMAGLVFGTLLYLAFLWTCPQNVTSDP